MYQCSDLLLFWQILNKRLVADALVAVIATADGATITLLAAALVAAVALRVDVLLLGPPVLAAETCEKNDLLSEPKRIRGTMSPVMLK
jgi:hypothetical protein